GNLEELRPLLDGEKPSPTVLNDALVGAARGGHVAAVKYLLSRGSEVARPSSAFGMTALDAAIRHGHRDVAEELVRGGARPVTAEQMAAMGLDRELAAAIDANPRLLAGNPGGEAPWPLLHIAAAHGRVATVESLLRRGVPVNLAGSDGVTPMHVAAMYGRKEMVAFLLDRNAAIDPHTGVRFMA